MVNVTAVIPTLNEEDSLPVCLDNYMRQMEEGDEVIVVDGGSEDGTVEVAESYGCRVIVDEGSSIGAARAVGTEEANGEVVASIDADSLPPGGWLDRVKAQFEQDEELVVLWGNIVDKNGVPVRNLVGKFSTLFRGASGNNTAFRKEAYDKLDGGYPDISFMEDVAIIDKLAEVGKAKRDSNLVMVMDMDRRRYQTVPMVAGGLLTTLVGGKIGGSLGKKIAYGGVGLVGTEMFHEKFAGESGNVHHDDLGVSAMSLGRVFDGDISDVAVGSGMGLVAHHALTEGFSKVPSKLMRYTDEVE